MSEKSLQIVSLSVAVEGKQILSDVNLTINPGEVHAIMGPNGAGKSTLSNALFGKAGYDVTAGAVTLDGQDLLALPTWQRARAGLFLAMQYPTEVPGVSLHAALQAAGLGYENGELSDALRDEAKRIGFAEHFLDRPLNVDLSGGEMKRNETVQLGVIKPKYAILDELDSGLDIDALRMVSERVEQATQESGLGVLVITHYNRLLAELKADKVHVLSGGSIVASGGPELALELENSGYAQYS